MYILIRIYYKGFDVLKMEMTLCIMVLYKVTMCSLLHSYHVSEKTTLISTLKMETGSTPEMYVLCKTTRRHIREENDLRLY